MSSIKWFNNLLFIENVLGVYRNYSNQTKIKKYFIIFQIFVLITVHTVTVTFEIYLLLRDVYNEINFIYCGFAVSAYITAIPSIVTSICYSGPFMSYVTSTNRVFKFFKDNKELNNSLHMIYRFSITFIILYFAFSIYRSMEAIIKLEAIILIPVLLTQIMLRLTIVNQYLMFIVVITVVVQLLKCLNSLILAAQKNVRTCAITDEQCGITSEQIQEWVELYRELENCCSKITLCFGRQFLFGLMLILLYYILMLYQFCFMGPLNVDHYFEDFKKVGIVIVGYVIVFNLPLLSGQMANNQGVKFHRVLARLYNTIIVDPNDVEAKLLKDFIRLIKKNPLEIRLLSKVPAGMYMLPAILTLAINYLVIVLQFNHVI